MDTPPSLPASGPRRGKRGPAAAGGSVPLGSQQTLPLGGEDDEDWRPGDSPAAQPAKKQRRPKRTKEEIEAEKALKAQQKEEQRRAKAALAAAKAHEKEERKALKQAQSKTHALKQVRLLVDSSLVGPGSLGVGLLAQLDEHNSRNAAGDKRINYAVAPLDLAPYKALRWQHRRLVAAPAPDSQAPPGSQQAQLLGSQQGAGGTQASGSGRLEEQWQDEPHVMLVFQPQELIDAVRADRLASLFSLLERRAPGQRPYLLVAGLAAHITGTERRQHQADMRAGPQVPRQQSVRVLMEQFVTSLAVECPRLAFRDVVDAAQAAQHVRLLTVAIANSHHRETDATVFLRAHDRSDRTSVTNLLINNPLEDSSLEPCLRCLASVPAVKPGIAHALATNYGSLGGLMDMLLEPNRSDKEKEQEIASLRNVGTATVRRVGPAAARQLLQLLRSSDPNLRIREPKEGEAAGQG
ncbi:hypothetical protein ABPG75_000552 [Micractinium tetrahymenae]